MPGTVSLVVTAGPLRGQRFDFAAHDTFLFGRAPDCHARLDPSDVSASRHHFLLEVNPPEARLRDLGSLNGTHVNGVRHGGRRPDETPEEAATRRGAEVDLFDGDEVRVGATVCRVSVSSPAGAPPRGGRSSSAAPGADEASLPRGATVGPYAVESLLGQGGMGAVYLAHRRDVPAEGPVALKVMLPRTVVDEAAQEIFLREIEVTRALRHPHIVSLLDFGRHEGRFFFALEYCPGGSAEALRRRHGGRVPLPAALRLATDALEGLAAAHEQGFVHRDLKPDNVLLGDDGRARLADFGLAKSFQQAGLSGLTATGAVGGTFQFMPREQLTSYRQVRPVSDVWSMAATVYFLLTGQYPRDFEAGRDPLAVILHGGVVPIARRDPALPADLAAVLDRALEDDPARRFADAGELVRALRAVL
jgi:serine/threonine protein kinase